MEKASEESMTQAEKTAAQGSSAANGGNNVVSLGPRDILQGRLEIQGDLKIAGNVEGDLKASGDVTIDSGATIQASIEGANVLFRLRPGIGPRSAGPTPGKSGRAELASAESPGSSIEGETTTGLDALATMLQANTTRNATTRSSAATNQVSGERINLRMTPR